MSIQALRESTTRRLGAGQALPSPAALVKELLDNAIDARATSIEVLLSANTLDKIEVRDNGSGIASDDLEQVGKRGHTSKLTCFEELRSVGRASLGFRGEALASACTMGELTITTRTEGDTVATVATLKPTGGIKSSSSKSHPIGTTVCVSNLFYKFPVRKQNFLKQTSKTISEIKDLLQSYALARLHIRITLKVLKSPKSNWTYVCRPQDDLREGAAKVIRKDVAAWCVEETHNYQELQGSKFVIRTLLPKPDSDLSKIKGGCYLSVDGRPLSSSRETISRKIYTGYKASLKDLASRTAQTLCKNPFLCVAIRSEGESYDPNVEPAKDDVLFASADSLVRFTDELFRSKYPPPPASAVENPRATVANDSRLSILSQDYDVLLEQQQVDEAQKRVTHDPLGSENGQDEHETGYLYGHSPRAKLRTPFMAPSPSPQLANVPGTALTPWTISNRSAAVPTSTGSTQAPFVLTNDTTPKQQRQQHRPITGPFQTPPASNGKSINQILPNAPYNPSPFSALPSKPPPGQKTIESWLTHSDDESHFEDPARATSRATTLFDDEAPFGHRHRIPQRQTSYRTEPEILEVETPARKQQKLGPAFVKAGSLSMGMNMTPPSNSQPGSSTAANAFNRPSLGVSHTSHAHPSIGELPIMSMDDEPPVLGHPRHPLQAQLGRCESEDGDFLPSQEKRASSHYRGKGRGAFRNKPFQPHRRKSTSKANSGSHRHPLPGPDLPVMSLDDDEPVHGHPTQAPPLPDDDPVGHGTLEHAMDFEHRKIAATRRLRDENALKDLDPNNIMRGVNQAMDFEKMMLGRLAKVTNDNQVIRHGDPMVGRPNTAFTDATSRPRTALPHDDPRAYFMKRQRSMSRAGHKVKRARTGLLPLETVPHSVEMHGLVLTIGIRDVNVLNQQMLKLGRWDSYVYDGKYQDGLDMTEEEIEEVEAKIKHVMESFEATKQGRQELLL